MKKTVSPSVRFDELDKALASLKKALEQPKNEFTRDASVRRQLLRRS